MTETSAARGAVSLVQPIAVDAGGSHWATVQAVAAAAALMYRSSSGDPVWDEWMAASVGKSVRRAKTSVLDKIAALELPHTEVRLLGARALAFAPVTYDQMDRTLARLQVAGTDLDREATGPCRPADRDGVDLTVMVDVDSPMSTGKLAAQVAHVVVGWSVTHPEFEPTPDRFVVVPVEAGLLQFTSLQPEAYVVHDAGHTEVTPGTLTAVGVSTWRG